MVNQSQSWIMTTVKRLFKQKWKFVIRSSVMSWCYACQWDSWSCHKLENEMFIPLDKHCSIFQIKESVKQENWNFETSKTIFLVRSDESLFSFCKVIKLMRICGCILQTLLFLNFHSTSSVSCIQEKNETFWTYYSVSLNKLLT